MFPYPFSFLATAESGLDQLDNDYYMEFDGVDDYIQTASAMSTSGTDWSIQLWFKTSQGGGPRIFVGGAGSKYFGNNWGKLTFFSADNSFDITSVLSISDGNWHHGVFTYNYTSGAWKLYIDNTLDTSQTATSGINIPPWEFFGAKTASLNFAECNLDEIAYWNIELSADDITEIYDATETGKCADLSSMTTPPVAWYRMGD